MKNEGVTSYMDYVANAASFEAFQRHDHDPLLSAEALPENSSLLDLAAFAKEYPEKFFDLVSNLRPEFQEIAIEYYVLRKSQYFIGPAHGQVQTRVWQNLDIIEQALGALIVLGTTPSAESLKTILEHVGMETTPLGSLSSMIATYAASRSYVTVAKAIGAPAPAIRKIFRPAITNLLASKSLKAVAVGAYLRNLSHQASLTKTGLSKRCLARTRRVSKLRFTAPPTKVSPLLSFGAVEKLGNKPWCMLEISSEHRMAQISPLIGAKGKRIFGKHSGQIFAPLNQDGELAFGYMFVRCESQAPIRALMHIRGIAEMSATSNDAGTVTKAITIPNSDVLEMIHSHHTPETPRVQVHDFVEIETGPAARYCGTVTKAKSDKVEIKVKFPTGRQFRVKAHASCVKILPKVPTSQRMFWGIKPEELGPEQSKAPC